MRLSSFWPPRRTLDRAAAEVYRRRHLDSPWLTRDAIRLLGTLLTENDRVLEWGSGYSTAWLCRRARSVRSVEHDPAWFERVRSGLQRGGLDTGAIQLLSTHPADDPARTPYVRAIDEFAAGELTVCLIDGEHRATCALEALEKLSPGGLLVIDDVQNYLDYPTRSPHSRNGRGPVDGDWTRVAAALVGWRMIWTSDGFSDTAFWIKS